MEAGSDTTSSTLLSFLLAMIRYPEEFTKARREVDEVCDSLRSPTSDDISRLPFIRACMNEVITILNSLFKSNTTFQTLRWRPVAAGGIPHMLTQDDLYQGYFLPKGTIVLANTWAIHHDDGEYDQPEEFIPDRFLNNKFGTRNPVNESTEDHRRTSYGFGAGRRVCPGQRLAKNSLVSPLSDSTRPIANRWLEMVNMAKIAWGFELSPGSGPVNVDIDTAYSDGFLVAPKKFPILFTPRSDKHRDIIIKEYEALKPFFIKFEN